MLFCLWDGAYKRTLAVNRRVSHVAAAGFLSHYLSGPLPNVRRHIIVNKMLSVSLKKTFPSIHPSPRQDSTYHILCCGALAAMRNSSVTMRNQSDDPSHHKQMLYHRATSCSWTLDVSSRKPGTCFYHVLSFSASINMGALLS